MSFVVSIPIRHDRFVRVCENLDMCSICWRHTPHIFFDESCGMMGMMRHPQHLWFKHLFQRQVNLLLLLLLQFWPMPPQKLYDIWSERERLEWDERRSANGWEYPCAGFCVHVHDKDGKSARASPDAERALATLRRLCADEATSGGPSTVSSIVQSLAAMTPDRREQLVAAFNSANQRQAETSVLSSTERWLLPQYQ